MNIHYDLKFFFERTFLILQKKKNAAKLKTYAWKPNYSRYLQYDLDCPQTVGKYVLILRIKEKYF